MCLIEVNNLYLSFIKEYDALHNVSFKIQKGETVAFVGSEDSGKSMLLRVLCGLEKFEKGEVKLNGISIKKINFEKDFNVAYLPKASTFFLNKSVYENLKYVLKIRNVSEDIIIKRINSSLSKLDILDLKEKDINSLSDYEKLLIQLVRASLRKVDLFLFDDIFTNLTKEQLEKVTKFVNEMSRDSTSIFTFTNDELLKNFEIEKKYNLNYGSLVELNI